MNSSPHIKPNKPNLNGESKHSMRMGTGELSKWDQDLLPRGSNDNTNYAKIDECPNPNLTEIQYVNKKYGRTIRNLDQMTKLFLKNDVVHGKRTVVTQRMVKPYLRGKSFDENDPNNYIYWDTCTKGLQWARLQYICEKWGVKLVEAPPYEG